MTRNKSKRATIEYVLANAEEGDIVLTTPELNDAGFGVLIKPSQYPDGLDRVLIYSLANWEPVRELPANLKEDSIKTILTNAMSLIDRHFM